MATVEATLTTGWEWDLPVDDTLVRRYLYHHADVNQAFVLAGGGRALKGPDFSAADLGRPAGYWNAATLLRPPADWDGVMDRIERFFAGSHGAAMLWSAWPTPDLRARGWRLEGHPPILARPPVDVSPVAFGRGPVVERVVNDVDLQDWERATVYGYPFPELQPLEPGSLAPPAILFDERAAFWVGREDGRPVSAGTSFLSRGIASLTLGATHSVARGHGHWRSHAVIRLRSHPSVWTAGVFSDLSRPLAEHLGFVPIQRLTLWVLARARTAG